MDSDHIMNIFVCGFWPPSHLLPHAVVSLQNALNTAAKIGGQLYKASEAEGDTRDALFQVRETERDRERQRETERELTSRLVCTRLPVI